MSAAIYYIISVVLSAQRTPTERARLNTRIFIVSNLKARRRTIRIFQFEFVAAGYVPFCSRLRLTGLVIEITENYVRT